jgi:hypothetical protein
VHCENLCCIALKSVLYSFSSDSGGRRKLDDAARAL